VLPPPYNTLDLVEKKNLPIDELKIAGECGAGRPGTDWHVIEVCILLAVHHNPEYPDQYLPNLVPGRVVALAQMSFNYNCHAYACKRSSWVLPGDDYELKLKSWGWTKMVANWPLSPPPPPPGIEYLVLYGKFGQDKYLHAAIWSATQGVTAKMGHLGTFQFYNIDTLSGGCFGNPLAFFQRAEVPP
jgi:hypothetical protein